MNPSPPETRASLILRLPNAADAAAWSELMEIYGPTVFRLALRRGFQVADAEDLVQEVFAAIARSVAKWLDREDRGKFRVWLLCIARNTAVNFLTRQATRTLALGGEDATQALATFPAEENELASEFDLEYRREVFLWAADQVRASVAEATWQAFALSQIESIPVAEVAQQLGVSVGTVYVSRSRVMSRLQKLVREFEVTQ